MRSRYGRRVSVTKGFAAWRIDFCEMESHKKLSRGEARDGTPLDAGFFVVYRERSYAIVNY